MQYIASPLDPFLPKQLPITENPVGFTWYAPYDSYASIIEKTLERNPRVIQDNLGKYSGFNAKKHRESIRHSIKDSIDQLKYAEAGESIKASDWNYNFRALADAIKSMSANKNPLLEYYLGKENG
jgi:hypothetical protein